MQKYQLRHVKKSDKKSGYCLDLFFNFFFFGFFSGFDIFFHFHYKKNLIFFRCFCPERNPKKNQIFLGIKNGKYIQKNYPGKNPEKNLNEN